MARFFMTFIGRQSGAIGITYKISDCREATSAESAYEALYDKYEHISGCVVTSIKLTHESEAFIGGRLSHIKDVKDNYGPGRFDIVDDKGSILHSVNYMPDSYNASYDKAKRYLRENEDK